MHGGGLTRAVVVHSSPARHCFLSLPRVWASFILPTRTPTFILEVSEGRTVALSWAGDTHNASEEDGKGEVHISGVVLRGCGVAEGEVGVLTQVPSPPPVSCLTVTVDALAQWQDLALNAEAAQSAILSQVRVVGIGQGVPLWLAGGACVTLRVLVLTPDLPHGILQPMTKVEVLPPPDNKQEQTSASITFTPQDTDCEEDNQNPNLTNSSNHEENSLSILEAKDRHDNFYTSVFSYMLNKLREQKTKAKIHTRKDVKFGFRIIPMPKSQDSESLACEELLLNHPSLIIISRVCLSATARKDETLFLGKIKKICSSKENTESANHAAEESKISEENKSSNKHGNNLQMTCTVIVWENYIATRPLSKTFISRISKVLKGNNCVVPNCVRRLLKLSILNVIELETGDTSTKSMPVSVDVLPLSSLNESQAKGVCEQVREKLKNLVNNCYVPVVINPNSLFELSENGNTSTIDILIRTRGDVPLLLTNISVALLDVTYLKENPSNLPYIHGSIDELNESFHAKHSFLGDKCVLEKLQNHITLSLSDVCSGWNALVQGSRGSGKTSLVESLVECLSSSPHHLHCDLVRFKQLRGKKAETVEKKLQQVFREAIFHSPSLIVLEDLDFLVGVQEQESGPFHEYTLQLVTLLQGLLDQLAEVISDRDPVYCSTNPGHNSQVVVVATCTARTNVHPLLVNPQGCHYFPFTFPIPPLDSDGRLSALKSMLQSQIGGYKEFHKPLLQTALHGNKENGKEELQLPQIQIDGRAVSQRMENFVLPDLSHVALRTLLHAKRRWQEKEPIPGHDKWKPKITSSVASADTVMDKVCVLSSGCSKTGAAITTQDVEAALEGYTPLALRGVTLSEDSKNTLLEVGGLKEAQRTLEETLAWPARYPQLLGQVKMRLRSGVLLYGPPGSGKTLLAHTVAATCKLNFITVKGPELLSKYIGASEAAVRDAFERASQARPCVLFFDEFESVGGVRGKDSTGVTDRVVNQLLTQLDGAEEVAGVCVLAATSRPDLIDPALLRPGRLDKCVLCPLPCESDRCEILQVLVKGVPLGEAIDWMQVAQLTPNFSGADLQSLLATAQVIVAQETLGAELYQGVISNQQDCKDIVIEYVQESEDCISQGVEDQEKISQHDKDKKINQLEKDQSGISHYDSKLHTDIKDTLIDSQGSNPLAVGHSEDAMIKQKISMQHLHLNQTNYPHAPTSDSSPNDVRDNNSDRNSGSKKERSLKHGNIVSTASSVNSERTGSRPKTRSVVQEQVVIEKEKNKVKYSPVRVNVLEENVTVLDEDRWSTIQELPEDTNEQYTEDTIVDVYRHSSPPAIITRGSTSNGMHKENKSNTTFQDSPNQLPTQEPDFKVYRRHIDAALKEVRPSVSAEDRLRYERLYATFKQSREGSFGQPTPGKRATLA
ncbi:hypothetical protein Pcinc_021136 [Petrolisthes cinctipes]|uniref:Peroxisomal ATPase PEX1 n=1 Tax=Petrolisthes cinctipes TaxID=88211 RepID=A0AAE1FI64_PETCI|nr:hypothetical protein Pcinc_021136 [Petrolisthes cinctipes]